MIWIPKQGGTVSMTIMTTRIASMEHNDYQNSLRNLIYLLRDLDLMDALPWHTLVRSQFVAFYGYKQYLKDLPK